MVAAIILFSAAFFTFTVGLCCLFRGMRKRRYAYEFEIFRQYIIIKKITDLLRRQKQQHFSRLVSDLNATEKFAIVGPSDDDDSD